MPTLNGVSCGIYNHEGRLEEYCLDELPAGGISCYIPAQSGQQFWLSYNLEIPIKAKAVSIEFHVDGKRVDTQCPLGSGDPPVVGPVQSSIISQYGKDEDGQVYRRDVFFSLSDGPKPKSFWQQAAHIPENMVGTIECKVFRAEKTGVWEGSISPEDLPKTDPKKSIRRKGVSHRARLGASMPAAQTTRYTFRNLDPEDAPYAYFRFYYRSYRFLEQNKLIPKATGTITRAASPEPFIPRSASPPMFIPPERVDSPALSIGRSVRGMKLRRPSLSQAFHRKRSSTPSVPEDGRAVSPPPPLPVEVPPFQRSASPAPSSEDPSSPRLGPRKRTSDTMVNLQNTISKLETDLNNAKASIHDSEMMQACYEKLASLKQMASMLGKKKESAAKEKRKHKQPTVEEEPGQATPILDDLPTNSDPQKEAQHKDCREDRKHSKKGMSKKQK